MRTPLRSFALLLTAAMLGTACGQLEGVGGAGPRVAFEGAEAPAGPTGPEHGEVEADAFAGFDEGESLPDPGDAAPAAAQRPEDGAPVTGAVRTPGDGARPTATDDTADPAPTPGDQPPATGPRQVRGQDRTGVTEDRIYVGSHAPVTGAAPLPSRSFEQSADLYMRWLVEVRGERVLGRIAEGVFADDRYTPSTAIQVCRQLAERVFLMGGAGGTDQIQACGRFANAAQVPYLSAGVTEHGLDDLDWYFAVSMTYRAQGLLLAQYVRRYFPGKKVAAVLTDTPNWDDAVTGWEQGVRQQGLDYFRTFRHPKGDTSWYNTVARELGNAGVDVLYINTSPVDYIRFAQQATQQNFRPQYVGVGITMGLNPVLGNGCPHVDGGRFFSPFPGLDWARENDQEFFQAAERFGTPQDDLSFAIWGQGRLFHELMNRYEAEYGTDLTREDFRDMLERQSDIRTKVFPRVSFSPGNNFGGQEVHVLRADCASGEHQTEHAFVSSF